MSDQGLNTGLPAWEKKSRDHNPTSAGKGVDGYIFEREGVIIGGLWL